jgi:hypothetical protein
VQRAIQTASFVTSHGDVDVDEEGYVTMLFEEGKKIPPDDALDSSEWVSEGEFTTWTVNKFVWVIMKGG